MFSQGPIICFGQQPNGFFPKGFFVNKAITARALQKKVGGKIVWFCHDSDHDYRETITKIKTDRYPEGFARLNINQPSKFEKLFAPLWAKRIKECWREETANKLQPIVSKEVWEMFKSIKMVALHTLPPERGETERGVSTVADFCVAMYRTLGWMEGIEVVRSSDAHFRSQAMDISAQDHYVDVEYKKITVHARKDEKKYYLNHGGNVKEYIPQELIPEKLTQDKLSPVRDNRFAWMQSVIRCTHYIYGKGEKEYLDFKSFPEVTFVPREEVHDAEFAVTDLCPSSP